jgi:hypothetical protein
MVSAVNNTSGQTRQSETDPNFFCIVYFTLYPLRSYLLLSYLTPDFGLFFEAEADFTGGGFIFGEFVTGEPTAFLNGEFTFPGP